MTRPNFGWICAILLVGVALPTSSDASVIVHYTSTSNVGLNAKARFEILNGGTTLQVSVTNNSVAPFGGGGADMVLSSLNFDLGNGIEIDGGNVTLRSSSSVVVRDGSTWKTDNTYNGDLNDEYGYSNEGVGNSGATIVQNISQNEIDNLLLSAVTSHSNGGRKVTTFNGDKGLPGGLDFGLVAQNSGGFGSQRRILDTVVLTLDLKNGSLSDFSFLNNGSYVEFGSDYAFIGYTDIVVTAIPEPGSIAVWSLIGVGCIATLRRRSRRKRLAS